MTEHLEMKAAITVTDEGAITGLAWPYSGPDMVGDSIVPGAFGELPSTLPILWSHDQAQVIGVWESIAETAEGLTVKGRLLVNDVARAREVRALIQAGAVTGLSIGFRATQADRTTKGRTIQALELFEVSAVAIPSHPGARISTIKSADVTTQQSQEDPMTEATTKAAEPAIPAIDPSVVLELKSRMDRLEAKGNRAPGAAATTDGSTDLERKAFADVLRGHALGDTERKSLTVANDAPSYVLAPEATTREFIRNLVEFSPVRTIADVRTTTSHTVLLPKRTAVTNAKWKGETDTQEASTPTFDQMEIAIRELNTFVDVSNWLIEDSASDVEAEVRLALAEDFAAKEGKSFVSGNTALEPKGFMTAAGVAETLNGHATNLNADALITLMYAMPAVYRSAGTWVMNGTTLAAVRKLKDGHQNYLWQPAYMAGQPETILGRPVVELVDMPDIAANAHPICFGAFRTAYRIYDRIELQIRPNPYLLATQGLVRYHARRRTGSDVVRADALRKLKMATS